MSDSISAIYDSYEDYKRACKETGFRPNNIYGKWDKDNPGKNGELKLND